MAYLMGLFVELALRMMGSALLNGHEAFLRGPAAGRYSRDLEYLY